MEKTNHRLIKVIITLTAIFMAFAVHAQDRPTAVLQHGDNLQAFYGNEAFSEALAAAQTGDLISLSTGTFKQTTINKAVKIQGAGLTSRIDGHLTIDISDGASGLEIEGIHFLNDLLLRNHILKDATIKRCQVSGTFNNRIGTENLSFIQCKFAGNYNEIHAAGKSHKNLKYINCYITGSSRWTSLEDEVLFDHCILGYMSPDSSYLIRVGNVKNCIILRGCSNQPGVTYTNVILPSDGPLPSEECKMENVTYLTKDEINSLFKDIDNGILIDTAASTYLGTDGTQLGIYGGAHPFTLIPAIPSITSAKIDSKVKEDGKLSVSITAETNN